ncbi:MAG TPA: 3-dehydroquinate synthase family protein [Myxococcaceae bacterium]|nr:3-dehydroquinate synthase family protein [Myxococcaceae bacterium]
MGGPRIRAPGAFLPLIDVWAPFERVAERMPEDALVVIDARVAALHPRVLRQCRKRARVVLPLRAGEGAKTLGTLAKVLAAGVGLPRSGALVAVGGGTIGDLCTVAAHLLKRGVRLIHVPTTVLAAVDSSVGGKGAVHTAARGGMAVKNAAGVFHYPEACWICPELFDTLPARALREGATEAWKMVACLAPGLWRSYRRSAPPLERMIRDARRLKDEVCRGDPYELKGPRRVLNFGHTFGHVLESLTRFRVSHGDAVGMGMLCALDVGRVMGVTKEAEEVEQGLMEGPRILGRKALAAALERATVPAVAELLKADKKAGRAGALRMVLLRRIGDAETHPVDVRTWRPLLNAWRQGARP